MPAKSKDPLSRLRQLVINFEEKETDLSQVPKDLVNEFGYACLSNSLMFKEPEIPKHDEEGISQYIQSHTFDTLNSLISYIKSLNDDIDKLFAIFAYAALNIRYDTEAFFSGNHKSATLESVFQTKLAVCEGYALFFREMSKRVGLNSKRIVISDYSNFSKAFGFDPLNPPSTIKSDHASVHITIDGVPFISEPTWAAGYLNNSNQFQWSYKPKLFLIPLYKSLCDHYPCDDCQKLLPFKFTFNDFFKSCDVSPCGINLKTESNPYVNIESKSGYLEQIYSCDGPIDWIQIHLYKKNSNSFNEIQSNGITSYEIIQRKLPNHPERCRFICNIAFPEKGFYEIEIYIDGPRVLKFYVNSLSKCSTSVPLQLNPFHDSKFIPISPKRILSTVKHGVALIRFAVSPKRSGLLWNIFKLTDSNSFAKDGESISRTCGIYSKLKIPFDDERYEDQLCITFPSNGRYSVALYLANDEGSYTSYITYYFDVTGASSDRSIVSPVEFMFKGRTFVSDSEAQLSQDQMENLKEPTQSELKLLAELKRLTDQDDAKVEMRRNRPHKGKSKNTKAKDSKGNDSEFDGKSSSKCCLLI
ncbi:hypothetical protein M9Y10_016878 [Tritrichomonas musculus]|uniref:Transglutaminase-like domain-containing protein n=1 Tax=Tritrichomonas musculus TaxID=1915356 RepID=A0ABR2HY59_9EUKA